MKKEEHEQIIKAHSKHDIGQAIPKNYALATPDAKCQSCSLNAASYENKWWKSKYLKPTFIQVA